MATIKDFLYFINERESIRLKRLNGERIPWTNDIILDKCRFANVDRIHDRGIQLLISFIDGMTIADKIIYSTLYRSCYSSPLLLSKLTGNIKEDLIMLSGNHHESSNPLWLSSIYTELSQESPK